MKTGYAIALLTCGILSLNGAEVEKKSKNSGTIRVVPVDPTPEPDHIDVRISFPKNGEMRNSLPIQFQFRVEGYPIGVESVFPRQHELLADKEGQALRITVDDRPLMEANEALDDALDNNETYYDETVEVNFAGNLKPGRHILRVFPSRSYGESLKGDGCFAAHAFYYKSEEGGSDVDLSAPYLTYNEPFGDLSSKKPVLLDFYISNCQLSKDGYKVRATIDGETTRIITQWVPYYIYGLKSGMHTLRLQLLDYRDKQVPGAFNDVKRTFTVK
jgi:hypothetical protein